MKNHMFVVTVSQHTGGHGSWSMPVKFTDNLCSAVRTAKQVEEIGFEFRSIDDSICIYLMDKDAVYTDCENLIFVRRPSARRDLSLHLSCYEEWRNIGLIRFELSCLIDSKDVNLPIKVVHGYKYSSDDLISRREELSLY